jgi:hypothetical protein
MLVEHVTDDHGHAPHVVPAGTRAGVEVDPELVGVLEVVGPHRMRVQVDAPEVDDPEKLCRVAYDDLSRRPAGWKAQLHRLDPLGMLFGGPFLKERLTLSAAHVALEHHRPRRDPPQRPLGHRHVVLGQVQLRVAGLWKEHLVRVGDRHFAPSDFQNGLRHLPHGDSVVNSDSGRKAATDGSGDLLGLSVAIQIPGFVVLGELGTPTWGTHSAVRGRNADPARDRQKRSPRDHRAAAVEPQ